MNKNKMARELKIILTKTKNTFFLHPPLELEEEKYTVAVTSSEV